MATTYEKERQLQSEIAPRIEHDLPGVEVLAVELASPDRFVVYVDHPDGVDHALCVRVTDALRDYLREYSVDVSSPGIERPLRTPAHFARAVGETVSVKTRAGDDHGAPRVQGRVRGVVTAADDTGFELLLDDGHAERIGFDDVSQARTVFEWGDEPKRGKSKKGSQRAASRREPVRR